MESKNNHPNVEKKESVIGYIITSLVIGLFIGGIIGGIIMYYYQVVPWTNLAVDCVNDYGDFVETVKTKVQSINTKLQTIIGDFT